MLFHPRDRERAKELTNKEFMTSLKPNSIIKREDETYEFTLKSMEKNAKRNGGSITSKSLKNQV